MKHGRLETFRMLLNIARNKDDEKAVGALFSASNNSETKRAAAWLASRLERAKRGTEMETETVTVSPCLAELMLERNENNRPVRKAKVKKLAQIMCEGRWRLTSQGLSFSRDGTLNDGQHRLSAVVESGVPVQMRITFGEDRDVFPVLDAGNVRNGSDAIHIAGYRYWNYLSAGARVYATVTSDTPFRLRQMTSDEILDVVNGNPRMEDVCTIAGNVASKTKCPIAPIVAAFYIIQSESDSADRLEEFATKLANGDELKKRDPVLVFRNMLILRKFHIGLGGAGAVSRSIAICAATILCWNRWIRGGTATDKTMTWVFDQSFPEVE